MTLRLVHLTKQQEYDRNIESSIDILISILENQVLIGTDTFVNGMDNVICFQDSPLVSLAQNAFLENYYIEQGTQIIKEKVLNTNQIRYSLNGLSFDKSFIWQQGSRPVIYEDRYIAKSFLSEHEFWRLVDFNLDNPNNITDWTHEREWRLKADKLHFSLNDAIVLLESSESYKEFVKKAPEKILKGIQGIVLLEPLLF